MNKHLWFALFFLLVFGGISQGQDNQIRLTAEKLQAEGEELFSKNTPEARENATPKFVEALRLWEQLGDDENRIKALSKLNDIAYYQSDFRQSVGYSLKILLLAQKNNKRYLEGATLGNIGFYHHLLGESRTGLKYLEKSAAILSQAGEKQRESMTLNNIGLIYYDIGEIKPALEYFEQALKLKRETNDRGGEGVILTNLGYSFNEGGNKRKALEYYEKALVITIETENRMTQGTVLSNIASVYQDFSEFQNAFEYYQQSLDLRRQIGDRLGQAVTMQNLASLYRTLGDFENALSFLNQSLEIYQKGGFRREEARALSSIGAVFSATGDNAKALEFYLKGLEVQKLLDNKSGYPVILRNIGRIYLERNETQKALEYFERALNYAEESGDAVSVADIFAFLARANEKLGKPVESDAYFVRAIASQRQIDVQSDLAETLYYYARFEENRGKRDSAIEKITEVLKIVENLRSSIASQNLRTSFLATQQKYYDFYISLLVSEHSFKPDKGFGALALQASESARARSLLDTLGETRRDIRAEIPPELIDEERILRQTINAKDFQRIEAVRQESNDKAVEFEKELTETLRRYQELQTKIRLANPHFASLNTPEPLKLNEIQAQILDDKTVLLEYALGEERSFLFFVTKEDLKIIELPKRESIEKPVRQTIENLKSRAQEVPNETLAQRAARLRKSDFETEKMLAQISRTLILPVADKIRDKRLLIVASGVLQYLPFAALSGRKSIESSALKSKNQSVPAEGRFLIETNEIVNLPSVSVVPLLRQIKKREKSAKNLITILADPVFSAEDTRLTTLTKQKTDRNLSNETTAVMRKARMILPNLRSDFSRLRFSRTEAEAISELALSNQRFVALDFAANLEAANSEGLQKSQIIHLATHGVVNSQFPELSSIVFSLVDENGESREGFLRLHDVYDLRLEADLVVLSACETALGKEIKGEGIVGLTRGFMYAGAPSVVASLWRVEDRATADLMKRFYQRLLRENLLPAAALRDAQISMLKEDNSAHPFYWAGFTLQGDWQ